MLLCCKAEVSNLIVDLTRPVFKLFGDKNVVSFEIPMRDVELIEILKPLDDLLDDLLDLIFVKFIFLRVIMKSASFAELHDDVNVSIRPEAIIMLHEIGTRFFKHSVGELPHDCDFIAYLRKYVQMIFFISLP